MATPFYVTTPIYYPNAAPHLGSAYTTAYADTMARWHRALGEETWFLTGTDEHGEKMVEAATAAGVTPKQLVDEMAARFRSTWEALGMTPHRFIRTTDDDHARAVQHFWRLLHEKDQIEFREYTGPYCVGCETFLTEREMVDGRCAQHLREPEVRSESNYFFRMSEHFDWWRRELERNPNLLTPERYRNEVLAMIADGGLGDLCISRPRERLEWGIPLPFDEGFVTYVWVDALVNYLTGIGYPDDAEWERRWAGVHHITAKDILKPHGVFWPTMLHAAGLPLYQGLHVHGYWTLGSQKISKSLGNLVDALALKETYGFEALRYHLLREMSFGLDAEFSEESLVRRINADLANDLGNLVNRSLAMAERYFDGAVPEPTDGGELAAEAGRVFGEMQAHMRDFSTQRALATLWELVGAANRHIDREAPWKLAKDPAQRDRLAAVMYDALEALRVIASLLAPFMPETSVRILERLGGPPAAPPLSETVRWGRLAPGARTHKGEALFPRIEIA
jgi:methionyl-tRNA synthetase